MQSNTETETETEKIDLEKKPQFANILVFTLWVIMCTLNLSTLFMEDSAIKDSVNGLAYGLAFGLAGYVAGIHLLNFIGNRRWNKIIDSAKNNP